MVLCVRGFMVLEGNLVDLLVATPFLLFGVRCTISLVY